MTILAVYNKEPHFPASAQNPEAIRYKVGGYIVDAIGGEPSESDVNTIMNPPNKTAQQKLESVIGISVAEIKLLLGVKDV